MKTKKFSELTKQAGDISLMLEGVSKYISAYCDVVTDDDHGELSSMVDVLGEYAQRHFKDMEYQDMQPFERLGGK